MVKPWKIIPMNDIFVNEDKTLFLLGSCAIEPTYGMTASYGKMMQIPQDKMKLCGLDIILKDLEEFPDREKDRNDKSELEKMSPKEEKKFHKEHKFISIARIKDDQLELAPMKRVKKGFAGNKETIVSLPITNEQFFGILMKVFDEC